MGKTHKKNSIAHFLFFCSGNYAYLARKVELDPLQIETVPGSLPYEVASYLVHLSNPEPTDVFLDPMCGAGTVLYARAQHPLRSLTGFDINSEAIKIARRNLKSLPVKINQTDSRLMRSVPDESFSKIIVNPPWDEKIIEGTDLLYSDMMEGFLRVLAPGGTVVLLTSKKEPMEKALRGALTVYPETSYGVADTIFINGIKAFVYRVFKA
jgi:23S rRNA G2445 N2-methylase RlmL